MMRALTTLLLGSGLAQLGPLLLAPVLSRQYGPEAFGVFHLASAIGANIAVVACARYEFALPMAGSPAQALALRALCLRILVAVVGLCLAGGVIAALWLQSSWPLAVPAMVAALGALSLWTLEATRLERHGALAMARITQFWGGGALQAAWGALQAGVWGLLVGPIVAAAAAAWALRRRASEAAAPLPERPSRLLDTAREFRDFPLLNTPHAFMGALQDTLSIALIAAWAGPAAAGVWGLALRLLKAPATLVGGAVAQVLYPRLGTHEGPTIQARAEVRRTILLLLPVALLLGGALSGLGPWALPALLGPGWDEAGPLSRALALYIALHFVASPLGVVTLAWKAQAWALKVAVVGQVVFLGALAVGLLLGLPASADGVVNATGVPLISVGGPLEAAGWSLSAAMSLYFAAYLCRLWFWPTRGSGRSPHNPG